MAEREDFSKTEIATAPESGVPMFSFPAQDGDSKSLTPEHFDIQGNKFTAFYDSAHKLIFVLDETLTENTPNALLTIGARDDRKWDDILANDFGMDLEDIRPKKNNKYQKLDIDYDGISVYNKLITDYKAGVDIEDALAEMEYFRGGVGKKLAGRRLTAAEREIETATATIEKTDESIEKLRAQIKSLKSKLAQSKASIGKKPTKESAAKILKIQSQSDKADEKMKRAQLRLRRAKKRLEDAAADAEAARKVLEADMPELEIKPREPEMADSNRQEEPKPLFEQDPEIMDEKIAFQPVEFDAETSAAPSFDAFATMPGQNNEVVPQPAPERPITPVMNTASPTSMAMPAATEHMVAPAPQPVLQPAIQMERPMAPGGIRPGVTVSHASSGNKKPTMIYYVMLIILIGLSILTLWLYQNRMDNATTPNLAATAEVEQPVLELAPIGEEPAAAPFIMEEPAPVMAEPEPIIEEPVFVPEPEPEPFYEEPVPMEPIIEEPAPEPFYEEPVPMAEPEPTHITKPEYSVNGPVNYDELEDLSGSGAGPQLCTSGTAPDEDGCCAGEDLRWVESYNGYGCCSAEDGECYPPLK